MNKDIKNENENNLEAENNTENSANEVNTNTEEKTQKENNSEEEEKKEEKEIENIEPPKDSRCKKLWNHFKKHPLIYILVTIIIVMFLWFSIKINNQQKSHNKEVSELISTYETKIDSINLRNIEFSTKVFSWSVRSEMIRNNNENIDQLFNTFVRESDASLLQLFNPSTNTISISTDKKTEGTRFSIPNHVTLSSEQTIIEDNLIRILIPITGMNERIGILNVEYLR